MRPKQHQLLILLSFLIGFVLLSMENIWIRETSLRTGSTLLSFTWIIATFLVSNAAGSLLSGTIRSHKARMLALSLAAWAVSALLLHLYRPLLFSLASELGSGKYLYSLLMASLPCFFAGMTFPLLSDIAMRPDSSRTSVAGPIYLANLFGSATGVLAGSLLLPYLSGFNTTFLTVSLLLGGTSLLPLIFPRNPGVEAKPIQPRPKSNGKDNATGIVVILLSGFLVMSLETLFFYYFRLLTVGSFFAVAAILTSFILGLGAGTANAVRTRKRGRSPAGGISRSALIAAIIIFAYVIIFSRLSASPFDNSTTASTHLVQVLFLSLLFAVPLLTFAGAIYPLAWELVAITEKRQNRAFGTMAAFSSLSGAVGVFLVPYGLVPLLGLNRSFIFLGIIYLGIAFLIARSKTGPRRNISFHALTLLSMALLVTSLCFPRPAIPMLPGTRVIAYKEGRSDVVAVMEDGSGSRHIVLNHTYRLNGTRRALLLQKNEAFIPMLFHPAAKNILFIGMASGISAASVLEFPVEALTSVELVPEVAQVAQDYFSEWNKVLYTSPASRIIVGDGRVVASEAAGRYDLVICDLFHPGLDGAEKMFSLDFFQDVKDSLDKGGLFCLWLPCHQLEPRSAGIITRTFLEAFPYAVAVRANTDPVQPIVGYIGSTARIDFSTNTLSLRIADENVRTLSRESPFLRSVANFRCSLVMDLRADAARFASFPLNTDDRPRLAYATAGRSSSRDRLIGFKLLEWIGRRPPEPNFPSLVVKSGEIPAVIAGIRAGNYYYASAAAAFIPDAQHANRIHELMQKANEYLGTAQGISPESDFTGEELQQ